LSFSFQLIVNSPVRWQKTTLLQILAVLRIARFANVLPNAWANLF